MLGHVSEEKLTLQEVYRFDNSGVDQEDSLRWFFQEKFSRIKTGLAKSVQSVLPPQKLIQY